MSVTKSVVFFLMLRICVTFVLFKHMSLAFSVVTFRTFSRRLQSKRSSNSSIDVFLSLFSIGILLTYKSTCCRTHSQSIQCIVSAEYPLYTRLQHALVVMLTMPGMSLIASLIEVSYDCSVFFTSRLTDARHAAVK